MRVVDTQWMYNILSIATLDDRAIVRRAVNLREKLTLCPSMGMNDLLREIVRVLIAPPRGGSRLGLGKS
jgi:hypothetical protein